MPVVDLANADRSTSHMRRAIVLAALLVGAIVMLLFANASTIRILLSGNHGLRIAQFQSAPLHTASAGADRVYLVSTQSDTRWAGGGSRANAIRIPFLHVDLWAIDSTTSTVAWRRRLRTYRNGEGTGPSLDAYRILGADGETLWLDIRGPLGVSLADGHVVADAARIEARNPRLAGKLVLDRGYVAFGRNGLQLTLDDASQWRIDAADLVAEPRDVPVSRPATIIMPAKTGTSASQFQTRALEMGNRGEHAHDMLVHIDVATGRSDALDLSSASLAVVPAGER
ncbi:MAG: PA2928 family protein [Dokdonella sp.]|uniref:PA2928 family protein n=1 Tax=Dokdonella sp. TaxID=2291710 RepID=UPI0032653ACB